MTKEEFEIGYCQRSRISLDFYKTHFVTLPCGCDYKGCEGWAKVSNDPYLIEYHMRFYAPKKEIG